MRRSKRARTTQSTDLSHQQAPNEVSNNSTTPSSANKTSSSSMKINKGSRAIKKSSRPSSSTSNHNPSPEQKAPVIIYTRSPTLIKTTPEDFMILVHKLTGMREEEHQQPGSSPPPRPPTPTPLPPRPPTPLPPRPPTPRPPPPTTTFFPTHPTTFLPNPLMTTTTTFLPNPLTTTTMTFLPTPTPPPPPPPTSLPVQQHRYEDNNRNVGGNLGIIGDNNETNNYYNNGIGGLSDLPMMNPGYLPPPLEFDHPTNLSFSNINNNNNNNYNGIPFFKPNSADFLPTPQSIYNNYLDLLPSNLPPPNLGNAYSSFSGLDVLKDLPDL